jgi:uncharacterized membrane protein
MSWVKKLTSEWIWISENRIKSSYSYYVIFLFRYFASLWQQWMQDLFPIKTIILKEVAIYTIIIHYAHTHMSNKKQFYEA